MPHSDASLASSRSEPALRGLVDEAELLAEAVFDTVQEGLLVLDSDLRVILANRGFYTTFQVRPVQTLDRLVYELGTGQWDIAEYEVKHQFPTVGYKVIRLNARKLRRRVDQTELILLALADITEERFLREQQQTALEALQRTEQSLRDTIEEKSMLLLEVHHRVKNNLQVIGSLLSLQAQELHEDGELRALQVAQNRVYSIAAVHDLLYGSTSAGSIDLRAYAETLSQSLAMAYGVSDRIQFHLEGGPLFLDVGRAVLVGLLLNELISNAYKHAFPDNRTGRVTIDIAADEEEVILSVTDTGVGTLEDPDSRRPGSLGLRLTSLLAQQLKGTLRRHSVQGTKVEIRFPLLATS